MWCTNDTILTTLLWSSGACYDMAVHTGVSDTSCTGFGKNGLRVTAAIETWNVYNLLEHNKEWCLSDRKKMCQSYTFISESESIITNSQVYRLEQLSFMICVNSVILTAKLEYEQLSRI